MVHQADLHVTLHLDLKMSSIRIHPKEEREGENEEGDRSQQSEPILGISQA